MDFLQQVFLESPLWLGIFSFGLFALVLFARRRWEGPARLYALPATLAFISLLFVVQWLVVTQREDVLAAQEVFVAAIERNDRTAFSRWISAAYESEGLRRDDVVGLIVSLLARMKVYDTRYQRRDVQIDGSRADMLLAARATVSIEGGLGETHLGSWRIGWAREADGWKIVSLKPVMVDTVPLHGMGDLRGHGR